MSLYSDVKENLSTINKKVRGNRRDLEQVKNSIFSLQQDIRNITETGEQKKKLESDNGLRSTIERVSSQYLKDIEETESVLGQLDSAYENKINSVTEANTAQRNKALDDYDISHLKTSSAEIRSYLEENLGKRFTDVIYKNVPAYTSKLTKKDFIAIKKEFQKEKENIYEITSNQDSSVNGFMKLLDKIFNFDFKETDKYANAVAMVIILALFIFAMKFVVPVYMTALVFIGINNVNRNKDIKKMIALQKTIETNIEKIVTDIEKEYEDLLNHKKQKIDQKMLENKDRLTKELENSNRELQLALREAEQSYSFDGSIVDRVTKSQIKDKENSIEECNKTIEKLELEFVELEKERSVAIKEMSAFVNDIEPKYMSMEKATPSYRLDRTYLFDIMDNKPIYFDLPSGASLILYGKNDEEFIYDFMSLLIYQTRLKLTMDSNKTTVYDPENAGLRLVGHRLTNVKATLVELADRAFSLMDSKEKFSEFTDMLVNMQKERAILIADDKCSTFEEFNDKMIELESAIMNYEMIFIVEPEKEIHTKTMYRLLRNCAIVGIDIIIFKSMDAFMEETKDSIDLLETGCRPFFVENGEIKPRAKSVVLDKLNTARK